jgi:uncharacterized protein YjbJ (UPF0337 family)
MNLFGKLKSLVAKNEKNVEKAIDKAADLVQSKTGDDMDKKVEGAADKAKGFVDGLDGQKD